MAPIAGDAIAKKLVPGYGVLAGLIASLHNLCKCLAVDLATLHVNVDAPSAAETKMRGGYASFMRDMSSKNPLLGKPAKPEDVAEAFVYLMKNIEATGLVVSTMEVHHLSRRKGVVWGLAIDE